MNSAATCHLTISVPARLMVRPRDVPGREWQELEPAPGDYDIPAGTELSVRLQSSDDREFTVLVRELAGCPALTELNLAENRNITNSGLTQLKNLPTLKRLNLSSVSVTSTGLDPLKALPNLTHLDLSYCNKLTDLAVKPLKALPHLEFLDLQGCVKITTAGLAKLRRRGLDIHK